MAIKLIVGTGGGGKPAELTFDQQRVRIGRGASCDIRLPSRQVSAVHAMIVLDGDRYFVVDPGSTNGTSLGRERLVADRRKLLRSGDVIGIGGFTIEFSAGVAMLSSHCDDRTTAAARRLAQQILSNEDEDRHEGASLVVLNGPQAGQRFTIEPPPCQMTIGRAGECDVILVDQDVSRRHAEVEATFEGVIIKDLGGKNPVLLADEPIEEHRLRDRDEILVGSTRLAFDDPVEALLSTLGQGPDEEALATVGDDETEPPPSDDRPSDAGSGASLAAAGEGSANSEQGRLASSQAGASSQQEGAEQTGDGETQAQEQDSKPPPPTAPREPQKGLTKGLPKMGTAGSELAVLLVGILALAACVAALVWIFR